jgi:transcriptional regulator with XRE-family HTH domain
MTDLPFTDDDEFEWRRRRNDIARFGVRVTELRALLNLTQRELADQAGVSHGYISFIETNKLENPSKKKMDAIARALGFGDAKMLLEGDEPQDELGNPISQANPIFETEEEALAWIQDRLRKTKEAVDSLPTEDRYRAMLQEHLDDLADWILVEEVEKGRSDSILAQVAQRLISGRDQSRGPVGRVPSTIDQRPIFWAGAVGDPLSEALRQRADQLLSPPEQHEHLLGPRGFGVLIHSSEYHISPPLFSGDVCWINPDRPARAGRPAAIRLWAPQGEEFGLIVAHYSPDLTQSLHGERVDVIGPVVVISRSLQTEIWIQEHRAAEEFRDTLGIRRTEWRPSIRTPLPSGNRDPRMDVRDPRYYLSAPLPSAQPEAAAERDPDTVADKVTQALEKLWPTLPEADQGYLLDVLEGRRQLRERVMPAEQEHEVADPEKPSQAAADAPPHRTSHRWLDIPDPPDTAPALGRRAPRYEEIFGADEPERS